MEKEGKMKEAKKYAVLLVFVMAVLLAFSVPAAADYSGDMPLIIYEQDTIKGGVVYNTTEAGDKYVCLDDGDLYTLSMSQNLTINIPTGATVKTARLYNYYTWSCLEDDYAGAPAQAYLKFSNGTDTWTRVCMDSCCDNPYNASDCSNPIDYGNDVIHYWDTKSQNYSGKKWDFPGGTFAWNVTPYVTGSGTYEAEIMNAKVVTIGDERFCTVGFLLLVVYEHPDYDPVEYWIAEGCDILSILYGVTPEEATTNATFYDFMYKSLIDQEFECFAQLSTVLCFSNGWDNNWALSENMVYFNDIEVGPSKAGGVFHIAYDEYYVGDKLSNVNVVKMQDRGDYESVHNAWLVVRRAEIELAGPGVGGPANHTINWSEAEVKINVNLSSECEAIMMYLFKYISNPHPPFPVPALSKYIDVFVEYDPGGIEGPVRVEMNYTDAEVSAAGIDEASLGIYYYDGSWKKCSDTGVDADSNTIWANLNETELGGGSVGSVLGAGGESPSPEKTDLVITDKWVCWPDNCTICYNLTNTGNGTAPAGHNTTLYVDGNETAHDEVPVELAPNASYIGCFEDYIWTYTLPEDNITVCADKNNTVDESNESNNCLIDAWKCGDVTGDRWILTDDADLVYDVAWEVPGRTFVTSNWAGDVTGDGWILTDDADLVYDVAWEVPGRNLNCYCMD